MDNHTIAERLREYANYLESQEMNVYRVRAYRKAAETVLSLDRPLSEIVAREGRAGHQLWATVALRRGRARTSSVMV